MPVGGSRDDAGLDGSLGDGASVPDPGGTGGVRGGAPMAQGLTAADIFKMGLGTVVLAVWAILLLTNHGRIDFAVHAICLTVVGGLYGGPVSALRDLLKGNGR